MQARALLMIEHRLIERMISIIRSTITAKEPNVEINPAFIDNAVDFMHVYADLTHHGKEEDILFRELRKRNLSAEDQKMMNELIEEHALGRKTTIALNKANVRYRKGDVSALADIKKNLSILIDFYPVHIKKEDKLFFPASRAYFADGEDLAMLAEFREFDQRMIHEKYKLLIQGLEADS